MDPAFWHARWQEGKIGFHEGTPNGYLVSHAAWLVPCGRILVPLCGKSEDLAFLAAHDHEVVGIELVESAVSQFFAEHGATPQIERTGDLAIYRGGAITVIAGDIFAVAADHVGAIAGIFDRAALVALPAEMRGRYVEQLRRLAPAATRELLVSIEYPPEVHGGPPFSVEEPEIRALFPTATVTEVGSGPDPQGRLDGRMRERCYTLAFD